MKYSIIPTSGFEYDGKLYKTIEEAYKARSRTFLQQKFLDLGPGVRIPGSSHYMEHRAIDLAYFIAEYCSDFIEVKIDR